MLKKTAEENLPSGARIICFRKVDGKFGASHKGNFIVEITDGGPADSAGLMRGDQLISINGINVEALPAKEITKLSEDVKDDVTLVVRYNPARLADLNIL